MMLFCSAKIIVKNIDLSFNFMLKLFCVPFYMQHKETPLIAGTKHCHLAVVKYLLESTEVNINATDKVSFNAAGIAHVVIIT